MVTSIPLAVLLLACAIGCMAAPGGSPPAVWRGTLDPNVPVMLPPQAGAPPRDSGDDPEFPRELRQTGLTYVLRAKICVSKTGTVDSMSILKGSDMALAQNVVNAVSGWRYRPLMANNVAVPFCFLANFEFKAN